MTDSELLEWAAKACGYTIHENGKDINGDTWYWCEQISDCWSPLTDDGDALRLAIALSIGLSLQHSQNSFSTVTASACFDKIQCEEESKDHDYCSYAATRRAIVRAAASIGEQMK